jgi:hypothetical protein
MDEKLMLKCNCLVERNGNCSEFFEKPEAFSAVINRIKIKLKCRTIKA